MNTSLLKHVRRSKIGGLCYRLEGIGQVQPVLLSRNSYGEMEFRIEGVERGRAVWWRFTMSDPKQRAYAKQELSTLLYCRAAGLPSPATRLCP
jgi:hypothetical protein